MKTSWLHLIMAIYNWPILVSAIVVDQVEIQQIRLYIAMSFVRAPWLPRGRMWLQARNNDYYDKKHSSKDSVYVLYGATLFLQRRM